jgi:hypothetical protein
MSYKDHTLKLATRLGLRCAEAGIEIALVKSRGKNHRRQEAVTSRYFSDARIAELNAGRAEVRRQFNDLRERFLVRTYKTVSRLRSKSVISSVPSV